MPAVPVQTVTGQRGPAAVFSAHRREVEILLLEEI